MAATTPERESERESEREQPCGKIARTPAAMRSLLEIAEQTVKDWPNVPDETYWTLATLPFLTLAACCVWLRVVWPCPEAAPKDFAPATLLDKKAATESSSLQGTSTG